MKVILTEKVINLGGIGEQVSVKNGYARNYLLPYGKAIIASKENIEKVDKDRAQLEKAAADKESEARSRAEAVKDFHLTITANASEEGNLYGSIGANEVSTALLEQGFDVKAKEVLMPQGQPIKSIVESSVIKLQFHPEVQASILLTVSSVEEEKTS